jgi:hypothetical protein
LPDRSVSVAMDKLLKLLGSLESRKEAIFRTMALQAFDKEKLDAEARNIAAKTSANIIYILRPLLSREIEKEFTENINRILVHASRLWTYGQQKNCKFCAECEINDDDDDDTWSIHDFTVEESSIPSEGAQSTATYHMPWIRAVFPRIFVVDSKAEREYLLGGYAIKSNQRVIEVASTEFSNFIVERHRSPKLRSIGRSLTRRPGFDSIGSKSYESEQDSGRRSVA